MFEQLNLFICDVKQPRKRTKPTKTKSDTIHKTIQKWNTVKHIYRYKTLYQIYNKIFVLTYDKPIKNVSYFIEDDGFMTAELKDTWNKPLKERLKLHIQLLRDIANNNVEYEKTTIINESNQETFFTNSTMANL